MDKKQLKTVINVKQFNTGTEIDAQYVENTAQEPEEESKIYLNSMQPFVWPICNVVLIAQQIEKAVPSFHDVCSRLGSKVEYVLELKDLQRKKVQDTRTHMQV